MGSCTEKKWEKKQVFSYLPLGSHTQVYREREQFKQNTDSLNGHHSVHKSDNPLQTKVGSTKISKILKHFYKILNISERLVCDARWLASQ